MLSQQADVTGEGAFAQVSNYLCKEACYAISIHPNGVQVAGGFREGVKIFYILEDEFKLAVEIPGRLCCCVKYSHGGHYLACGNGNVISIVDPYTFEVKHQLQGHPNTLKLLEWTENDTYLVSVCNNGSGYGWSSNFDIYSKGSRTDHGSSMADSDKFEFYMKLVKIYGVAYDEDYDLCAVVNSDFKVIKLLTLLDGCFNRKWFKTLFRNSY